MDHLSPAPAPAADGEDQWTRARNARVGLVLFTIYVAFYGGFVLVNAFWPAVMDIRPLAGVNLAILSGLGLIGAALLLALVYAWLCRSPAAPVAGREGGA